MTSTPALTRAAIEALYRSHGHLVRRRARTLLGDETEADDVVQQVFAGLIERPEQFAGRSKASTFLYVVTTHACLTRLRTHNTRARIRDQKIAPALAASVAPAHGETLSVVRDLLGRVDAQLAEVAVFYFVDEMTQDEIAEALGCSRRHVGDLLDRFREQVRARATDDAAAGGAGA